MEKTREKENSFIRIFSKNNMPIILFFIILINYIPLILPNMVSKESHGVGVIPMAICFGIECIILSCVFFKKIEITKIMKNNIIVLSIITIILLGIQVKNYFLGEYQILDFINIICLYINILLLFIDMMYFRVNERKINIFMKLIVFMGVVACINNMILYFNEILKTLGIIKLAGTINMKSFFANRNQFAFFLYITIIANIYVIISQKKNLIYKFLMLLFLTNLFFSMSRTGLAVVGIFFLIYFLTYDKIKLKNKIIILVLCTVISVGLLLVLMKVNSQLVNYIGRFERIKDLSGRTDIWERGINLLFENPINLLFGVGRFQSTELLKFETKSFSQFHNIYIDSLVTGGIMFLAYVIYIYSFVIRKLIKSNINKKYKALYIAMFITFAIYICFESFGRFSIGCSDTLCLVFFVAIPLLHTNSIKKEENLKGKDND